MRTNNKNLQGTIRAQGPKNFEECLDALKLISLHTGYSVLGIIEKEIRLLTTLCCKRFVFIASFLFSYSNFQKKTKFPVFLTFVATFHKKPRTTKIFGKLSANVNNYFSELSPSMPNAKTQHEIDAYCEHCSKQ